LPPDVLKGRQAGFGFEDPGSVILRVARGFGHIAGGDGLVKMFRDELFHPLNRR
jgi:hypothetical protein